MMENGAKMEPKGEPKSIKLSKKGIKKMTLKFDAKKRRFINLRQHRTGSALNVVFCDRGLYGSDFSIKNNVLNTLRKRDSLRGKPMNRTPIRKTNEKGYVTVKVKEKPMTSKKREERD